MGCIKSRVFRNLAAAIFILSLTLWIFQPTLAYAQAEIINQLPTDQRIVALTFDDYPMPGVTEGIVNILKQEGVTATFFLVGAGVRAYPAQAQYIGNSGFPICNHTYNHPFLPKLPDAQVIDQVNRDKQAIEDVTGIDSEPFFRPPYGALDSRVIADLNGAGYNKIIFWTIDTVDWNAKTTPDQIIQRVESGLKPGAIILMHVSHEHTVQVLPTVINYIKSQGYSFVNIPDFFGLPLARPSMPGLLNKQSYDIIHGSTSTSPSKSIIGTSDTKSSSLEAISNANSCSVDETSKPRQVANLSLPTALAVYKSLNDIPDFDSQSNTDVVVELNNYKFP